MNTPLCPEKHEGKLKNAALNIKEWILRYYLIVPDGKGNNDNTDTVLSPPFPPWPWDQLNSIDFDTLQEVLSCAPTVNAGRPITRKDEIRCCNYFSDKPRWFYPFLSDLPETLRNAQNTKSGNTKERKNYHLQFATKLLRKEVYSNKTYLGILEDMILDEYTWKIDFLIIRGGMPLGNRTVVIESTFSSGVYRGDIILDLPDDYMLLKGGSL